MRKSGGNHHGNFKKQFGRDHGTLQECHTRQQYPLVPAEFARVNDACPMSAARLTAGLRLMCLSLPGSADMPAYIRHHDIGMAPVLCPGCIGLLPMVVRDVEPQRDTAKIDFIYECSDCGAEVRQTVTKPEWRH
jgi:hypothetical protein